MHYSTIEYTAEKAVYECEHEYEERAVARIARDVLGRDHPTEYVYEVIQRLQVYLQAWRHGKLNENEIERELAEDGIGSTPSEHIQFLLGVADAWERCNWETENGCSFYAALKNAIVKFHAECFFILSDEFKKYPTVQLEAR